MVSSSVVLKTFVNISSGTPRTRTNFKLQMMVVLRLNQGEYAFIFHGEGKGGDANGERKCQVLFKSISVIQEHDLFTYLFF